MLEQTRSLLRLEIGLEPGHGVLLAVSGGVDSMVMLEIFVRLAGDLAIGLTVAHLDHQLRPDSNADADFVAAEAARLGVTCVRRAADVSTFASAHKYSLEDAARRLRYQFLKEAAMESGCCRIALGHHADDQAETILMRLLRGSGSRGLGGMRLERDKLYIRPFLLFPASDIHAYAEKHGVAYRVDPTNTDVRFTRNRVRAELIPLLSRRFNPNLVATLGRTARLMQEEDDYLDLLAQEAARRVLLARDNHRVILDVEQFLSYHIAIGRRVIRLLLQALTASDGPFDFDRVNAVLATLGGGRGILSIGHGLEAQCCDGNLLIYRGRRPPLEADVRVPGTTDLPCRQAYLSTRLLAAHRFAEVRPGLNGHRVAFDAQLLGRKLVLRSLRSGDRFQPLGMTGTKKLRDFLIDAKVPRIARQDAVVLISDGEIAWVIGMRPSHGSRVTDSTTEIAVMEYSSVGGGVGTALRHPLGAA